MAVFPDLGTNPETPMPVTSTRKMVRSESEAGYIRTRARSVRSFKKYTVKYTNLDRATFDVLLTFLEESAGESFSWLNPLTQAYEIVIHDSETIPHTYTHGATRVDCTFDLTQV